MRPSPLSPIPESPASVADLFLEPIEVKALALAILAIVISATTAFVISVLPSLLAIESPAGPHASDLPSSAPSIRSDDEPPLSHGTRSERHEWEQIVQHDELLSALTERAEWGYETHAAELRPLLLALGREIDEARFAWEVWRAERHSQAAPLLRARLEQRLATMHQAGLRALAARHATDGIGRGLLVSLSTSDEPDSGRSPEPPADAGLLSADRPTPD